MNTSNIPFFVLAKPETFTWTVRVPVPADGKYIHVEFVGVFKYIDEAADRAMCADQTLTDRDRLTQVLVGVEGIKDAAGAAVPSSDELVKAVIAMDRAAPVAFGTYLAARRGLAAEKNS